MTTNNPVAQPDGVVEVELLPCPFCGPGQSCVDLYFDDTAYRYRVGCGRCGCSTGISPRDTTAAPAVTAWNTRAPTPNSIAEQARRVVAAIIASSPWMRQFEVTPKERERLASIITTEFGASGGNS